MAAASQSAPPVAFVSAYFTMPSKVPPGEYLRRLPLLLSCLPAPLVLFTDAATAQRVASMPQRCPVTTVVLASLLDDVPLAQRYAASRDAQCARDPERGVGHSWELSIVWAAKTWFVQEARRRGLLAGTRGAYWIDAGYVTTEARAAAIADAPLLGDGAVADAERIHVLGVADGHAEGGVTIGGGMFGGAWSAWAPWSDAWHETLREWDAAGRFWGKDQSVMLEMITRRRVRARVVLSEPQLGDWWYLLRWLQSVLPAEQAALHRGELRAVAPCRTRTYCLTCAPNASRQANVRAKFGDGPQFVMGPTDFCGRDVGRKVRGTVAYIAAVKRGIADAEADGGFTPFTILEDDAVPTVAWWADYALPSDADSFQLGISLCGLRPFVTQPPFYEERVFAEPSTPGEPHMRVRNMLSTHGITFLTAAYARAVLMALTEAALLTYLDVRGLEDWDVPIARLGWSFHVRAPLDAVVYQDGAVGGQEGPTRVTFRAVSHVEGVEEAAREAPSALLLAEMQALNDTGLPLLHLPTTTPYPRAAAPPYHRERRRDATRGPPPACVIA